MFLFGFGMASVAKAQQKMSNHCTSKSRNLELHSTMSVFLLAASLDFQVYWRALPSFPVLANTGSGKLWLAQKLKVCITLSTRRDSGREESEEGGNGYTLEEGPLGLWGLILLKKGAKVALMHSLCLKSYKKMPKNACRGAT